MLGDLVKTAVTAESVLNVPSSTVKAAVKQVPEKKGKLMAMIRTLLKVDLFDPIYEKPPVYDLVSELVFFPSVFDGCGAGKPFLDAGHGDVSLRRVDLERLWIEDAGQIEILDGVGKSVQILLEVRVKCG